MNPSHRPVAMAPLGRPRGHTCTVTPLGDPDNPQKSIGKVKNSVIMSNRHACRVKRFTAVLTLFAVRQLLGITDLPQVAAVVRQMVLSGQQW